jgi:hypothetical protein
MSEKEEINLMIDELKKDLPNFDFKELKILDGTLSMLHSLMFSLTGLMKDIIEPGNEWTLPSNIEFRKKQGLI